MQGVWVRSLVEELRSCMLHSVAKKKKKRERERFSLLYQVSSATTTSLRLRALMGDGAPALAEVSEPQSPRMLSCDTARYH